MFRFITLLQQDICHMVIKQMYIHLVNTNLFSIWLKQLDI